MVLCFQFIKILFTKQSRKALQDFWEPDGGKMLVRIKLKNGEFERSV